MVGVLGWSSCTVAVSTATTANSIDRRLGGYLYVCAGGVSVLTACRIQTGIAHAPRQCRDGDKMPGYDLAGQAALGEEYTSFF